MTPAVDRPVMPAGYGVPATADGQLPWSYVDERMAASRNYWVGTTRPDGRPHAMPVWGVWKDGRFYFSTDRGSQKARNLTDNAAVVVHLESGDEVVILEGLTRRVTDDGEHMAFEEVYAEKYDVCLSEMPGDVSVWMVMPRVVFAWKEQDFPRSTTRWIFDR